ncbi:peptidoglycan DD-metalloendopeptidase family protein [Kitasatospora sp. NPDC088134]|uniref:M23 family metallopeptidase n=1 Tax=Kitasatospora sp. NPDC088134 TaxID=3364071 RepID=UPI0038011FB9
MSAQGKHRKPRLTAIARIVIATGVVGAAIGLPVSAASAHGTADHHDGGRQWAHVSVDATPVADTADSAPAAEQAAAPAAASHTYKVVSGDTLSRIADAQDVDGGWQKLYQDNRSVIGGNPDLIRPGQQLTVNGQAPAAAPAPAKAAPAPAKAAAPAQPSASSADTAAAKTAAAPKTTTKSVTAKAQTQVQAQVQTQTKTQQTAPAASTAKGYVAPAPGSVTTGYKVAGSNWSSGYHTGIDFPVSTGTSLKAIAAGTVVSAGNGGAYGNQVVIKLADGKYAQYAHLSSISVSAGQSVTAGQQIGLSGATGNVTGPHLHFEIRTTPDYGSDIDPVAYLAAHGVNV